MERHVNPSVRIVVEIDLVTKHPVCVPLGRVPMDTSAISAEVCVLQSAQQGSAILILDTASVAWMVSLVTNVSILVLPIANHVLTGLSAMHASRDSMVNTAKEIVHFVVAAVGARSRVERVTNIFAKKTITVQNAQKYVDQTVRDLVHLLMDDVLQNVLQEGMVHIVTETVQITALRVNTQNDAQAALSDIMETRVRWIVRTVTEMDRVTYQQLSVRMDAFLDGKVQNVIQVNIDELITLK